MCGIVGALSIDRNRSVDNERVINSIDFIEYRGPDSRGMWASLCGKVKFGHARLAIVDLSELGNQPMLVGNNVISFNGEIYNYVELRNELISLGVEFSSSTDTEVILQGYSIFGNEFFKKLNGAYAFSIYNGDTNEVVICRDRAGEKPLYYIDYDGSFFFSSDLKALLEISKAPRKITKKALFDYFYHGYSTSRGGWVEGVSSLEPGTYLTVKIDDLSRVFHSYWSVSRSEKVSHDYEYLRDRLSYLLNDSVKLQLRCDVPASVLLSGGVDSSLLTAIASQHVSQVKTFTVKFPGFSAFDESESARLIARHFSTEHHEIEGVDISPELLLSIGKRIDVPINDSSLLPTYLVNQAVAKHCKVALSGDGGDELFGGYKHYERFQMLEPTLAKLKPILKHMPTSLLRQKMPLQYKSRNWLKALEEYANGAKVPNIRAFYDEFTLSKLLPAIGSNDYTNDDWGKLGFKSGASILELLSVADFHHYLRDSILVKSDRCSMLNSIESRAPILDYRIIDFAFNEVPNEYKINKGIKKFLLKGIAKDLLPPSFDFNRKLGFNLPLGSMIRKGDWKSMFGDMISSNSTFINTNYAKELFDRHLKGEEHTDRLFAIILFLIWSNENNIVL
ncbi:asparagine synthase (glutamine-hydrolyzing) [Pseudoalteromonas piscicida]|uniref:asparagine synthase (glutamine-hydrolyzing) n=1 Tax=Pseudoalteromonas piscicida TaxID=43662 RepID=A0ABM6NJ43_PSEO7|nr:asparagine synthase (glutamine-hydrolyzing) [Pseudoalteromonas piscicida]ATD08975.1 asparagine synthase (glutamine-hydrolysing) [Pseudoalteromonas piscicida]WPU30950.1 asparagine synthase (glutamine-hydrolyzing) [Pseudoalteromonas piscicida]